MTISDASGNLSHQYRFSKVMRISELFQISGFTPFLVSFFLMIGVGLIEALGLGLGHFDIDGQVEAPGQSLLGWVGLSNGIPILIWLTCLLGCFTLAGLTIQQLALAFGGAMLPWYLAVPAAFGTGGVANRFIATKFARLVPAYESTVIAADDLVMRRGTILEGSARRGQPARAKVIDQHKQAHYVMVEPHHDDHVLVQGEVALLVRKEGNIFFGLPDEHPTLRSI